MEYYHVTWPEGVMNMSHMTYFVEGVKSANGSLFGVKYRAISYIRDGKRVKFKTRQLMSAGEFPANCKFRKLKKNPFI